LAASAEARQVEDPLVVALAYLEARVRKPTFGMCERGLEPSPGFDEHVSVAA
jgi:hypothetical protein